MIIEYIIDHQPEFWILLGFLFLAIEIATGFVSGMFLFVGIGALISGVLMMIGVIPETWTAGIATTGIASGLSVALLWQPLKKLQGSKPLEKDNSSDLIGHEFELSSHLDQTTPSNTKYSGVNWRVELDVTSDRKSLNLGETVKVSSVEVGLFVVKPKS